MATCKKGRNWTDTELKYFCIVLADENTNYAHQLDSLALKKSANKKIFEEVKEKLEEHFESEDFKREIEQERLRKKSKYKDEPLNLCPEKLKAKFKWIKDQWKLFTDRVKKASGKPPIKEPAWYLIINPIFSDTQGELSPCTKSSDLIDSVHIVDNDSEKSDSELSRDEIFEDEGSKADKSIEEGETDLNDVSDSSSDSINKRKLEKKGVDVKPIIKKARVKTQTQAIHELAKSFCLLGEAQQKRSDALLQAECNRAHELKMLEIIMKYGQNSGLPPQNHPQSNPQFCTPSMYNQGLPNASFPWQGFVHPNQAHGLQGLSHQNQVSGSKENDIFDLDNQTAW
jgi:hypothetical protein